MSNTLDIKIKDLLRDEVLKAVFDIVGKTPSIFNKQFIEATNIKKVVALYILKNPWVGELKVKVIPNFPNALYNTNTQSFILGIFNSSVIAHEMEHAINTRNAGAYTALLGISKLLSTLTAKAAIPLTMAGSIGQMMSTDKEKILGNKLLDTLSITHGLASLPILWEEGKANLFAALNSPEKIKALQSLLPAYATYVGKTALPIGMYQGYKKTWS